MFINRHESLFVALKALEEWEIRNHHHPEDIIHTFELFKEVICNEQLDPYTAMQQLRMHFVLELFNSLRQDKQNYYQSFCDTDNCPNIYHYSNRFHEDLILGAKISKQSSGSASEEM